jgi:hypothetical protein
LNFKLLDVDFKVPEGYAKSSDVRHISVESQDGQTSKISLDNNTDPTVKLADGTILFEGSHNDVTLDASAASISTQEKYLRGSDEISVTVKKFAERKQVCRALKSEVGRYSNVVPDSSVDGYRARADDGKHILCTVYHRCLVVVMADDSSSLDGVLDIPMSKWGLAKIAFGVFMILFGLFAAFKLGFDYRIIFIICLASYFIFSGRNEMASRKNDCPKFKLKQ